MTYRLDSRKCPSCWSKTNVVTGGANHHQASCGSGGRPAQHNAVPDYAWSECLGTTRSDVEEEEDQKRNSKHSLFPCCRCDWLNRYRRFDWSAFGLLTAPVCDGFPRRDTTNIPEIKDPSGSRSPGLSRVPRV